MSPDFGALALVACPTVAPRILGGSSYEKRGAVHSRSRCRQTSEPLRWWLALPWRPGSLADPATINAALCTAVGDAPGSATAYPSKISSRTSKGHSVPPVGVPSARQMVRRLWSESDSVTSNSPGRPAVSGFPLSATVAESGIPSITNRAFSRGWIPAGQLKKRDQQTPVAEGSHCQG